MSEFDMLMFFVLFIPCLWFVTHGINVKLPHWRLTLPYRIVDSRLEACEHILVESGDSLRCLACDSTFPRITPYKVAQNSPPVYQDSFVTFDRNPFAPKEEPKKQKGQKSKKQKHAKQSQPKQSLPFKTLPVKRG